MGSALILVAIGVVLLVGVFYVIAKMGKRQQEHVETVESDAHALRYQLPAGHDPAVVLADLDRAGYLATIEEQSAGPPLVLITTAGDSTPDREDVRRVLAGERKINFEGDTTEIESPRFADE